MKKYVFLGCALTIMTYGANAQDAMATTSSNSGGGIRIGAEGGINLNNMLDHYQGETTSNQLKVGFHVGGIVDIAFNNNWSLQPGLRYIMKGGQQENSQEYMTPGTTLRNTIQSKDKITLHYVELPVNVVYKFGSSEGAQFFLGVGGYAAGLVSAQTKYKTEYSVKDNAGKLPDQEQKFDGTTSLEVGADEGKDDIMPFDFGVNGLLGIQLPNRWYAKAGVELGLSNLVTGGVANGYGNIITGSPNVNATSKNVSYLLTVGYMF